MSFEALIRVLYFSVGFGLVMARFSKPKPRIVYTQKCCITKHHNQRKLMFRIANERLETLVNTRVEVSLVLTEEINGRSWRSFHKLNLVHESVPNFSLPWTVMHVIDKNSKLCNKTRQDLKKASAIIFVLVQGIDTVFERQILSRHTYLVSDIIEDHQFADMFGINDQGQRTVDFKMFNDLEHVWAKPQDSGEVMV